MRRQPLRRLLIGALTLVARATDRYRAGGIPVWVFHSLDDSGSPVSTAVATFEGWISYLQSKGFRLMTAGEALAELSTGPLRGRLAAITFDDAYASVEGPLTKMASSGTPATVFVPTACIGDSNVWDRDRDDIPKLALMNAEAIERLSGMGVEFGSHTASHVRLTGADDTTAQNELASSRSVSGTPTSLLAYPYGAVDDRVARLAGEAGYTGAFTTELAVAQSDTDRLRLPRFPGCFDSQLDRLIAHRGYHWYRRLSSWFGWTSHRPIPRREA